MRLNETYKPWIRAVVMGILTVVFCLVIADGILGTDGHMLTRGPLFSNEPFAGTYDPNDGTGLVFFWVSILAITALFVLRLPWRYTWVNLVLYFVLWFPVSAAFGNSPQHTYLDKTTSAFLTIGPDLSFLRPIVSAVWFWLIQSTVYLVFHTGAILLRKVKNT